METKTCEVKRKWKFMIDLKLFELLQLNLSIFVELFFCPNMNRQVTKSSFPESWWDSRNQLKVQNKTFKGEANLDKTK
jgi:hypothetical protein